MLRAFSYESAHLAGHVHGVRSDGKHRIIASADHLAEILGKR